MQHLYREKHFSKPDLIFLPFFGLKILTLSVRDAQWWRDGPVGADIIVKWALDEAYVVKQRRSGEMVLLNWSGRAPVPVAQVEELQLRKLKIPVQVLVGTVAPSFPLSQMLRFPFFSD